MPELSLSSLDAVNQIGIALLLAYLNLERYRYRKNPLELLKNTIASSVNDIKSYDDYKKLDALSSNLELINSKFSFKKIKELPTHWGNKILVVYFSSNFDRYLTILFYILLAFSLVIATNYYPDTYKWLNQYLIKVFYATIFFSSFPLLNIAFGTLMKKSLLDLAKEHVDELNKTIGIIKQANQEAIEKTSLDNLTDKPK